MHKSFQRLKCLTTFAYLCVSALFLFHSIGPRVSTSSVCLACGLCFVHQRGACLCQEELFHSLPEWQVAGGHLFLLLSLGAPSPTFSSSSCQWVSSSGTTTKGSVCCCQCDRGGLCELIQAACVSHGGELTLPEMERRVMSWKSY